MEEWRQRAVDTFPELRRELTEPDEWEMLEIDSVYDLWGTLSDLVRKAHRAQDDDMLARIYGYASWSTRHPSKDIWNAAGVAFYEHIFDEVWMRWLVIPWLDQYVVDACWGLWAQFSDLVAIRWMLKESGFAIPGE